MSEILSDLQPMYSVEYEQAVLGTALFSRPAAELATSELTSSDFGNGSHRALFDTIAALVLATEPVDSLTVNEKIKAAGLSDQVPITFIHQLENDAPAAAHADFYIAEVRRYGTIRKLYAATRRAGSECLNPDADPQAIVAQLEQALHVAFGSRGRRGDDLTFSQIATETMMSLFGEQPAEGIPSGIAGLDQLTEGWQDTDLIVIGGLPGSGKSALANSFVLAAAKRGLPVHLFSLEMSRKQMMKRFFAAETGIHLSELRRHGATNHSEAVGRAAGLVGDLPVKLHETGGLTEIAIRSMAREWQRRHGTRLIVIDYLQRIQPSGKSENENAGVTRVIQAMKEMAKELGLPVIILSALSRESGRVARGEGGASRRPVLSDLRASGSIESEADLVLFCYRRDYHEGQTGNADSEMELILQKHRNGPTGTVNLRFEKSRSRFVELDTQHEPPPEREGAARWS